MGERMSTYLPVTKASRLSQKQCLSFISSAHRSNETVIILGLSSSLYVSLFLPMYVYGTYVCGHTRQGTQIERSEDNFVDLIPIFHFYMDLGISQSSEGHLFSTLSQSFLPLAYDLYASSLDFPGPSLHWSLKALPSRPIVKIAWEYV